jgi:hypothetical protein
MNKHNRTNFVVYFIILLLMSMSFGSCNPSPAATPTPPPSSPNPFVPLSTTILEAILAHFVAKKTLDFNGEHFLSKVNRHKGYFVWRRAWWLGGYNQTWAQEPGQLTLIHRLESEYDAVEAYLSSKIGTDSVPGPYAGGTDPKSPPHLDLDDVARRYVSDRGGSEAVKKRVQSNKVKRKRWTIAIVWRAAAIYDGLWQPSPDGTTATLKTAQLDEILDRRLRVIERMAHNVSSEAALGGRIWPKTLPGPNGPWKDGFRVRMFEYARVPNNKLFTDGIGSANIEFDRSKPDFGAGKSWRVGERGTRFEYNVAQPDRLGNKRRGLYLPASQSDHWLAQPLKGYTQFLAPNSGTAADVLDHMFTANPPDKWEDWWGRTWMWCDHVLAAIHLDALLLAKRRRDGNANAFNNIVSSPPSPDYVLIGAVVGVGKAADRDKLMADDKDPFFDNVAVNVNDLQIGDHLIFWNSFIYRLISTGDWRLENALVMEIDSDPKGGIRVAGKPPSFQLNLQGHGTGSTTYGNYTGVIAEKLRGAMAHLQTEINTKVSADPTIISDPSKQKIEYSERKNTEIIYWSPYEDFTSPGAWWIKIPRSVYRDDWGFASVKETVTAVKKAVGHESGGPDKHIIHDGTQAITIDSGSGYNPPPDTDAVYFPIFVPRVAAANGSNTLDEGWYAYLRNRSASGSYRPRRTKLDKITIDGTIMPGMFYRGGSQPIPIVRPKVN